MVKSSQPSLIKICNSGGITTGQIVVFIHVLFQNTVEPLYKAMQDSDLSKEVACHEGQNKHDL